MGCLPEDFQTLHNLQQGRLLRMARSCTEHLAAGAHAGTARNLAAAAPTRTHHATAAGLVVRPAHKADFFNLSIGRKHGDQVLLRTGGGHLAHKQARHACGGDMAAQDISGDAIKPWRRAHGGPDGMPAMPAAPAHCCRIVSSLTNRPALGKVPEAAQRQRASAPPTAGTGPARGAPPALPPGPAPPTALADPRSRAPPATAGGSWVWELAGGPPPGCCIAVGCADPRHSQWP